MNKISHSHLPLEQQNQLKAFYGVITEDFDDLLFIDILSVANDIVTLEFFNTFFDKFQALNPSLYTIKPKFDLITWKNSLNNLTHSTFNKDETLQILLADLLPFTAHENHIMRHTYCAHYLSFCTLTNDNESQSYHNSHIFKKYLEDLSTHNFPLSQHFKAENIFHFISLNIEYVVTQIKNSVVSPEKHQEYLKHISDLLDALDTYTISLSSRSSSFMSKADILKHNQIYQCTNIYFYSQLDQLNSDNPLLQDIKQLILERGHISAEQFSSTNQITYKTKEIFDNEVVLEFNIPNTIFFSYKNIFVNGAIASILALSVNNGLGGFNPVHIFLQEINQAIVFSSYNSFLSQPTLLSHSDKQIPFESTDISFIANKDKVDLIVDIYKGFVFTVIEQLNSGQNLGNKLSINYNFVSDTFREIHLVNEINKKYNFSKTTLTPHKKI